MTSRFWTRTTWVLTLAAMMACLIWIATGTPSSGWLTLLLLIAAIAAAYPAISEQEGDEIGHCIGDDECDALAQWADARQHEHRLRRRLAMGKLQDRAERALAQRRAGAHDPAPPEPSD